METVVLQPSEGNGNLTKVNEMAELTASSNGLGQELHDGLENPSTESNRARGVDSDGSKSENEQRDHVAAVDLLAQCLPNIIPNVLINKRDV